EESYGGGLTFVGRRSLQVLFGTTVSRVRTGGVLLDRTFVPFRMSMSPSGWLSRIELFGEVGQDIDVVNVRSGRGGNVTGNLLLRPTRHVSLDLVSSWSWLDV